MFTRFADVPEELRARRFYADALQHSGKSEEARRQLEIARLVAEHRDGAPGYARRLANLKASVLASAIDRPSSLPPDSIVMFWAKWCAVCEPELDALSHYSLAKVVTIDVDRMDPLLREYVPMASLESAELPQLYIVDARGQIRFHVSGYAEDGFFLKKLDWMIDAVKN